MRALSVLLIPCLAVACVDSSDVSAQPSDASTSDSATTSDSSTDTAASDSYVIDTAENEDTTSTADVGKDSSGGACGGIAGTMCPSGHFCSMPTGTCTTPDAAGTCERVPVGCTKELNPVCGCDGKTYSNPCMATLAGMNVRSAGACGGVALCGGAMCPETQYCDHTTDGACAGDGVCKPRPGACPGVFDPVCGCNGIEYSNDCAARAAGVDYASKGRCPP